MHGFMQEEHWVIQFICTALKYRLKINFHFKVIKLDRWNIYKIGQFISLLLVMVTFLNVSIFYQFTQCWLYRKAHECHFSIKSDTWRCYQQATLLRPESQTDTLLLMMSQTCSKADFLFPFFLSQSQAPLEYASCKRDWHRSHAG